MQFIPLTPDHLPRVIEIVATARAYLARQGLDQWQNGYPDESDFRADIEAGDLYGILDDDGMLMACCAVIFGGEPTYNVIYDGAWQTDREYAAVHRVAVDNSRVRRGYASRMFEGAKALAEAKGLSALRIDTHPGNIPMQKTLEKNGFVRCGTIILPGDYAVSGIRERVAFEKDW